MTTESIKDTALALLTYCREHNWAGYDPYDALNSRVISVVPVFKSRLARIALTQAMKRAPINLRRLLTVPRTQNPKAVALILSACLKLEQAGMISDSALIDSLVELLVSLRSPGVSRASWGYSFPWQTRTVLVPAGAPNLVCTCFAANALLDAYEHLQRPVCLDTAVSAAEYLANDLYWQTGDTQGFGYPLPSEHGRIHNANLLSAALLCRVHTFTGRALLLDRALAVARQSAAHQHQDGSWYYGEAPAQRWIDNFHTGYNLCALHVIRQCAATSEFDSTIQQGLNFYLTHFFREDGAVRYFHNRAWPVDIHCVAQSIVTLADLNDYSDLCSPMALRVLRWAMTNMLDKRGYFYYRALQLFRIRISYMRWSQAWMLLALATALSHRICEEQRLAPEGLATVAVC